MDKDDDNMGDIKKADDSIKHHESLKRDIPSLESTTNCDKMMSVEGMTVSEVINKIGFGRFQSALMFLLGFGCIADAMEMMILAILAPALHCEWNITELQQATLTTVVFLGMMISSPLWGKFADKQGRRRTIISAVTFLFLFGFLSAFAPSFGWVLFFRGCVGVFIGGVPQGSTLYAEYQPSATRGRAMSSLSFFWALGSVFEALLALWIMPNLGWRYLVALSSAPLLIFLMLSRYLPESPMFLAESGQTERTKEQLQQIASLNSQTKLVGNLRLSDDTNKAKGRVRDLFAGDLIRTTIPTFALWLIAASSYYGVVLLSTELLNSSADLCSTSVVSNDSLKRVIRHENSSQVHTIGQGSNERCKGHLTEHDYLSLAWTTLAEFPGTLLAMFLLDIIGRRKTMGAIAISFSISVSIVLNCDSHRTLVTVALFAARGLSSGFFQTIYIYTAEVFPTHLRALALGSGSAVARIGAMITPFVAQVALKSTYTFAILYYVTLGLIAAIASYLLSVETSGRSMYMPMQDLKQDDAFDDSHTSEDDTEKDLKSNSKQKF